MVNKNIIIIGQQPWDTDIGSNCKNIAIELSRNNKVLYVNSPLDRITLYKKRSDSKIQKRISVIKGESPGLVKIQHNLWNLYPDCLVESINWINNTSVFDFFNKRNNKKFAKSIQSSLKELSFDDVILFNDNEMFKGYYLNDFLKPSLSIYYSRDFMLAVDYWKKHGERIEPLLIAKSDICLANSVYLSDYCKQYNNHSYYVGQGCDLEVFKADKATSRPKELDGIDTPVIGYVGALQSLRLDMEIVRYIADQRKDWTVVLVGPEDEDFKNSDLHTLKNVVFTGSKPISELPSFIQYFDVCINPQLVNPVTIGNYPRKVDEYLAMGKPTVATKTRAMEIFEAYTYLSEDKESYVANIDLALRSDNEDLQRKRMEFAATHSWENCIKEIYRCIETATKRQ